MLKVLPDISAVTSKNKLFPSASSLDLRYLAAFKESTAW